MKYFSLFFVGLLFISCCNDDDFQNDTQLLDPLKISEYHIVSSSGVIGQRYVFNNDGDLSKYYNHSSDFVITYSYDSQYQLINISKYNLTDNSIIESRDIIYDSNDRVTQIGNRIYTYDSSGNFYTADNWSNNDTFDNGNYIVEEYSYNKFHYSNYNSDNPIIQMTYVEGGKDTYVPTNHIDEWVYENEDYSHNYRHDGFNLIDEGNWFNHEYSYDEKRNPLKFNLSNIEYLFGLIHNTSSLHSHLNILINTNNKTNTHWDNSGGPEETRFQYDYNDLELPLKGYARGYYTGIAETDWYHISNYYYQGDIIPIP